MLRSVITKAAASGTRSRASAIIPLLSANLEAFVSFCHTSTCDRRTKENQNPPQRSQFFNSERKQLEILLSEKCKTGFDQLDDALTLFNQMARVRPWPSVLNFSQLLGAIVKMKHYSHAVLLFRIMCILGIPFYEGTMNIAINCFCHLNRVDFGFAILGRMFKCGCDPDATTFCTLIKGLFWEDKVGEAVELFDMVAKEKLCEITDVMLATVINGLCKSGNTVQAVQLLSMVEEGICKPNIVMYNTIIDSLCKDSMLDNTLELAENGIPPEIPDSGEMKQAVKFLETMTARGCEPDIQTYGILMNGYCKKGKVDDAFNLFQATCRKGLKPTVFTYNIMLQGLFQAGRCADALKFLAQMQAQGESPDTFTHSILINGLCKNGLVSQAQSFLCQMENDGITIHVATYTAIIDGLCEQGNFDLARDLFSKLPSRGLKPNVKTFTVMLKGLCQEGLLDDAKELLTKMKMCGCSPNSVTYNVVVQGFLKNKEYHQAKLFVEEMLSHGFAPDASTSSLLLESVLYEGQDPAMLAISQRFKQIDKQIHVLNDKSSADISD